MRIVAIAAIAVVVGLTAFAQGRGGAARPAATRPAPRWSNGTINLGALPGQIGMWDGVMALWYIFQFNLFWTREQSFRQLS